jgi:hypothetical protein
MDETRRSEESHAEAELRQPEEAIKDLEPSEQEGQDVTGGAIDSYMQFEDTIKDGI